MKKPSPFKYLLISFSLVLGISLILFYFFSPFHKFSIESTVYYWKGSAMRTDISSEHMVCMTYPNQFRTVTGNVLSCTFRITNYNNYSTINPQAFLTKDFVNPISSERIHFWEFVKPKYFDVERAIVDNIAKSETKKVTLEIPLTEKGLNFIQFNIESQDSGVFMSSSSFYIDVVNPEDWKSEINNFYLLVFSIIGALYTIFSIADILRKMSVNK